MGGLCVLLRGGRLLDRNLLVFWTNVLICGALAAYGGCREWWGRFQTRECPFMRYELRVNVMFHVV